MSRGYLDASNLRSISYPAGWVLAKLRQLEDRKDGVWVLDEDPKHELEFLKFRLCHHSPRKLNFCDPEVPVFVLMCGESICGCFGQVSLGRFLARSPSDILCDNVPSMRSLIKGILSERQWRERLRRLESIEMKGPTYSWFARAL